MIKRALVIGLLLGSGMGIGFAVGVWLSSGPYTMTFPAVPLNGRAGP